MKKLILASALFLTITGLARAADMPLKAPPPPPLPAFTWTGVYGGGYVGGLWSKTDNNFVYAPPASWQQTASVGVGGGILGAQYQWGNVVFGVEGNVGATLSGDLGTAGCSPATSCLPGRTITADSTDAIWTAGGRAGWAFGNWLPYVSGGYANASFTQTFCAPGTACLIGRSSHDGAYIGGGLDWAVWGRGLVVGLEYRHFDFQTEQVVPSAFVHNTYDTKPKFDTLTFRLTYLFSPW